MGKCFILPRDCKSRALFLEGVELPSNYMEDFSLMGFLVDKYDSTISFLNRAGYRPVAGRNGAEIHIDGPEKIPELSRILSENGIACDWADIADTVYQA